MKSRAQIIKSDRKRAAYHEAGHAVVALAMGLPKAKLTLAARTPVNPREEVYCIARVFCAHQSLKPLERAALGYAGWIAEALIEDEAVDLEDLKGERYQFFNESSETDIMLVCSVNETWYARAVVKAHGLVTQHWESAHRTARALLKSKNGWYVANQGDLKIT